MLFRGRQAVYIKEIKVQLSVLYAERQHLKIQMSLVLKTVYLLTLLHVLIAIKRQLKVNCL